VGYYVFTEAVSFKPNQKIGESKMLEVLGNTTGISTKLEGKLTSAALTGLENLGFDKNDIDGVVFYTLDEFEAEYGLTKLKWNYTAQFDEVDSDDINQVFVAEYDGVALYLVDIVDCTVEYYGFLNC
jgi:hypothetical protein